MDKNAREKAEKLYNSKLHYEKLIEIYQEAINKNISNNNERQRKFMQDKLVSIAMATYNGEKYLREQLDSIYNQTYKNIEVIVCDDCSTDKTVEILEKYSQKHGLKYYINEKNLGYSKNFEKAASFCNGEYIAFSDQDDIWLPEKIETLINEITKDEKINLIFSDSKLVDKYAKLINESRYDYLAKLENVDKKNIEYLAKTNVIGCTILTKKDFILKWMPIPISKFNKKPFAHDNYLIDKAINDNSLKFLNKQLILYRIHGENVSAQILNKKWHIKIKDYLKKYTLYKKIRKVYWNFKKI